MEGRSQRHETHPSSIHLGSLDLKPLISLLVPSIDRTREKFYVDRWMNLTFLTLWGRKIVIGESGCFEFVEEIIVHISRIIGQFYSKKSKAILYRLFPLLIFRITRRKKIFIESSMHDRDVHPDPNHIDRSSLVNAKRDQIKRETDSMEFDCSNDDQRNPVPFYFHFLNGSRLNVIRCPASPTPWPATGRRKIRNNAFLM